MTKKLKAITLTETLVYIAIFSIFMLTIMQFFVSIQINQIKIHKELEMEMNRIFLTNHFEENLKYNFVFDPINSTINGDKDTLVFKNKQESITYKVENGNLILDSNMQEKTLTNRAANMQSFYIEPILDQGGNTIAVKINGILRHKDDIRIEQAFSTLIKLANYEG